MPFLSPAGKPSAAGPVLLPGLPSPILRPLLLSLGSPLGGAPTAPLLSQALIPHCTAWGVPILTHAQSVPAAAPHLRPAPTERPSHPADLIPRPPDSPRAPSWKVGSQPRLPCAERVAVLSKASGPRPHTHSSTSPALVGDRASQQPTSGSPQATLGGQGHGADEGAGRTGCALRAPGLCSFPLPSE